MTLFNYTTTTDMERRVQIALRLGCAIGSPTQPLRQDSWFDKDGKYVCGRTNLPNWTTNDGLAWELGMELFRLYPRATAYVNYATNRPTFEPWPEKPIRYEGASWKELWSSAFIELVPLYSEDGIYFDPDDVGEANQSKSLEKLGGKDA